MPVNPSEIISNCDISVLGKKYGLTSDNVRNNYKWQDRTNSFPDGSNASAQVVTYSPVCHRIASIYKKVENFCRPTFVACEAKSTVQEKNDKKMKQIQQLMCINSEVQQFIDTESSMDRLKRFLATDFQTDEISFQLEFAKTAVRQITVIGFLFGTLKGAKDGREGFLKRNQATMYMQKRSANKKYYNTIVRCMIRESLRYSIKSFCFIFPVMLVERCLTVYRNTSSPLHMMAGTATYGMLAKFFLGPKGMFAGAVIGGGLGLVAGVMYEVVIVWLAGETQEKANYNTVRTIVERNWRNRGQLTFDEDS